MQCELCENVSQKQQRCSGKSRYCQDSKWTCPDHSSATCVPTPTEDFRSPTGASCSSCNTFFRAGATALRCNSPGCDNLTHKGYKCSLLPRNTNLPWTCSEQSGNQTPTIAGRKVDLLRQQTLPKGTKITCSSCKKTIASGTRPISCRSCPAKTHKSCLMRQEHTRDEVETFAQSEAWACKCDTPSPQTAAPSRPLTELSQRMETLQRTEIRILQWNADGLLTKWVELGDRLAKDKIDIALVQETKLKLANHQQRLHPPEQSYRRGNHGDRPHPNRCGLLHSRRPQWPF